MVLCPLFASRSISASLTESARSDETETLPSIAAQT
jgi:hypothetical protein